MDKEVFRVWGIFYGPVDVWIPLSKPFNIRADAENWAKLCNTETRIDIEEG